MKTKTPTCNRTAEGEIACALGEPWIGDHPLCRAKLDRDIAATETAHSKQLELFIGKGPMKFLLGALSLVAIGCSTPLAATDDTCKTRDAQVAAHVAEVCPQGAQGCAAVSTIWTRPNGQRVQITDSGTPPYYVVANFRDSWCH